MPSHNQLTSTIIDDEELIDELRRYGEKNLPTIGTSTTATSSATTSRKKSAAASAAAANNLNDQNREIYLKKLNHYKAREKIETNPSKQYIKQNNFRKSLEAKRISNIYKQYDETDEVKDDEDDDIIEIDSKNATSEYVQVNNANTSPMSTFTYQDNDYYSPPSSTTSSVLTSTINNLPQQQTRITTQTQNPTGYVRLKDRIELDKTLSKYRSEINSILNNSIARNRNSESIVNKIYNTDVIKKESQNETTKTLHCPKPHSMSETKPVSLFGSIKSKFFNTKPVVESSENANPYDVLKQIRGSHLKSYNNNNNNGPIIMNNNEQHLTNIRKTTSANEDTFLSSIGTCVSNLGLTISKLLPYLVIIIFFLITIMYLRMKMINDPGQSSSVHVQENQDLTTNHFYCADVKDTKCSGTKELLKELINYLRIKSGNIDCSQVNGGGGGGGSGNGESSIELIEKSVHLNQIIDHFTNDLKLIKIKEYQDDAISSMLKAVLKNPHWQIRMLDESYADVHDDINKVTYLMSEVSSKSFMCRFKELAHFIWVRVVMFTSIIVTLITGYFVYSKIRLINIEKDREYYDLIKQVTCMVEQHYELSLLDPTNIKPFIAISHVFHHLFDPSQREAKKKLWSKVVDFIQNQESRIHLETQFINGEETNVWKWAIPKQGLKYNDGIGLANSTMLPIIDNKQLPNKIYPSLISQSQTTSSNFTQDSLPTENQQNFDQNVLTNGWQGDAFNRSDKLAHSPTPCLKIRNMFDSSLIENDPLLSIRIHNDILEKCSVCSNNMATILHIICDKKSKEGCVYIKCSSNEAAGFVYQILNGTWYNGKLLNVKFLRSDRYVERFPDSISYTQQLRPILI